MSELAYCFSLGAFGVFIICFVLAFIERPGARFFVGLVLFIGAFIVVSIADEKQREDKRQAEAEVARALHDAQMKRLDDELADSKRADESYERAKANGFRPMARNEPAPPAATPVPLFYPPTPEPRRAPTAAEVNAELLRKYGR